MIWHNTYKYKLLCKIFKSHCGKEVLYLKNLIEREEIDKDIENLVKKFLLIDNNIELQEFVKTQPIFEDKISDDILYNDFWDNKEKIAYIIIEVILNKKI